MLYRTTTEKKQLVKRDQAFVCEIFQSVLGDRLGGLLERTSDLRYEKNLCHNSLVFFFRRYKNKNFFHLKKKRKKKKKPFARFSQRDEIMHLLLSI